MKTQITLPHTLIKQLNDLVKKERYVDLYDVFPDTIEEDLNTLTLTRAQAYHLLWAVEIKHSKACLKYPYRQNDNELFDPQHQQRFDKVQDFYQTANEFLGIAVKELEQMHQEEKSKGH